MLEQLRGRNVTHIGCSFGLILGLLLGMIAAVVVIQTVQAASAVTLAVVALIVVTLAVGALGFYIGWRFSPHGPRPAEALDATERAERE